MTVPPNVLRKSSEYGGCNVCNYRIKRPDDGIYDLAANVGWIVTGIDQVPRSVAKEGKKQRYTRKANMTCVVCKTATRVSSVENMNRPEKFGTCKKKACRLALANNHEELRTEAKSASVAAASDAAVGADDENSTSEDVASDD